MDVMEAIKNIATILGCIISATTVCGLIVKFNNKLFKKIFDQYTKEVMELTERQEGKIDTLITKVNGIEQRLTPVEEESKQSCRNTIKTIYYKYHKDRKIPLYERKTADYTYKLYSDKFHGNTYAELLYKEICKWEIIDIDDMVLQEE